MFLSLAGTFQDLDFARNAYILAYLWNDQKCMYASLSQALMNFRIWKTGDPRDCVYGLLGLIEKVNGHQNI